MYADRFSGAISMNFVQKKCETIKLLSELRKNKDLDSVSRIEIESQILSFAKEKSLHDYYAPVLNAKFSSVLLGEPPVHKYVRLVAFMLLSGIIFLALFIATILSTTMKIEEKRHLLSQHLVLYTCSVFFSYVCFLFIPPSSDTFAFCFRCLIHFLLFMLVLNSLDWLFKSIGKSLGIRKM